MNALWNQQCTIPMLLGREKNYVFIDINTIKDGMIQNEILKLQYFYKDRYLNKSTLDAFMINN